MVKENEYKVICAVIVDSSIPRETEQINDGEVAMAKDNAQSRLDRLPNTNGDYFTSNIL
ncbi:MAG: hypothetical protein LBU60_04550 [Clostridiales bacterium]|jgi:hypothetical protein|nr:hypothetical protein [Clostridiales bacterium]